MKSVTPWHCGRQPKSAGAQYVSNVNVNDVNVNDVIKH